MSKKYILVQNRGEHDEDEEDEVQYKDDHLDDSTDVLLNENSLGIGNSNSKKSSDSPVVLHFNHDDEDEEEEIDLNDESHSNHNNNDTIINFSDNNNNSNTHPFGFEFSSNPGYSTSLSNWRNILRVYRPTNSSSSSNNSSSTYSSPTTTTTTTNTSVPLTSSTPPPSQFNTHFPLPLSSRWENSQLKEKDTIIIKQPDGKISLGLNSAKFYHHLRTGEHDPNALYMGLADPDILLQHYNQRGNTSNEQQDLAYLSDYDGFIHSGNFESYRRKKFLISLMTCEIFYSALLMAEVLQFNSIMLMLILVIISNLLGLFALTRNRLRLFNIFIFYNFFTIVGQIVLKMFTPLFLLRLLNLMIAVRVRHEMILGI